MDNQEIEDIISKYLSDECSEQEKSLLDQWRQADEEHENTFARYKKLWELSRVDVEDFRPDTRQALKNIDEKIQSRAFTSAQEKPHSTFYYLTRIAAIIIIAVGITWVGSYTIDRKTKTETVHSTTSQKQDFQLPDGTTISLNTNSSVTFTPERYAQSREVLLEGEAYFDVVKNSNNPFIVKSGNAVTQVLGTSFNIRSRPSEKEVIVTVTSGKVAFFDQSHDDGKIYLTQGDQGVFDYNSAQVRKSQSHDRNALSWKTGKLIFDNTPFQEVGIALSRHYNKKIVIEKNLLACRLTSTYDNQTLNEILREFYAIQQVAVKDVNGTLHLTGNACQ